MTVSKIIRSFTPDEHGQSGSADTAFDIMSLDGRLVRPGSITGSSQFVIELDELESGLYLLKLQGKGKEYSIPFVKK